MIKFLRPLCLGLQPLLQTVATWQRALESKTLSKTPIA